jgi:hypothetical protein
VLLDFAGDCFKGNPLPTFSNEVNANIYLQELQSRFIEFTENRILVSNLIRKIGGDLENIPWYRPITYTTYVNSLENLNFIGSVKDRYTQAKELGINKSLRISVIGGNENGIYIGVKEMQMDFAVEVADCLVAFQNRGLTVPKVHVTFPTASSESFVERTLYREHKDSSWKNNVVVNVMFVVKDNSAFLDDLVSDLGREAMINWIVDSLEVIVERENENDMVS